MSSLSYFSSCPAACNRQTKQFEITILTKVDTYRLAYQLFFFYIQLGMRMYGFWARHIKYLKIKLFFYFFIKFLNSTVASRCLQMRMVWISAHHILCIYNLGHNLKHGSLVWSNSLARLELGLACWRKISLARSQNSKIYASGSS